MRKVKEVKVGQLVLNGKEIFVQSMLNARSDDIEGNVSQAVALEKAGCQIQRVSIPNKESIKLITAIKQETKTPLVADIHFDYRLAVMAAEAGIDKIRINPGNIGSEDGVREVVKACRTRGIPIRIGVNSGSLEKEILSKYGSPTPDALVESALFHARILERFDFDDIVISIKSSNVKTMLDGYRLLSTKCNYPLHLGVTEAGTEHMGLIKSAIGIGSLLADSIGETIRVSLTADPVAEVKAGYDIIKAAGRAISGVNIVSCPTCGRTRINIIEIANQVEKALANCEKNITVAVMGCVVNGPGEAKEADFGIAGGDGVGLVFKKGEIVKKVAESELVSALLDEINNI